MKKISLLILFCLFFTTDAFAKDLYVSINGNDSVTYANNDINNPWRSIDHGADTMLAGDTLYIRGGTYSEGVTISSGGSVDNYKTIQNYPDETPILDATGKDIGIEFASVGGLSYVKIIGLEIKNASGYGITNVVYRNYVFSYIEIRNCNIHHNGSSGNYDGGIYWFGDKSANNYVTIDNNEIHHNSDNGLTFFRTTYSTISNNLIYLNPPTPQAAAENYQLYIGGIDSGRFTNNSVHDNYIYFAQKSNRVTENVTGNNMIYNNVFAYSGFCGLDVHDTTITNVTLKNNIFAYNGIHGTNPKGDYTSANKYYNNVFYANGWLGIDQNDNAEATEWQNNIFSTGREGVWIEAGTSSGTHDYNCYDPNLDDNVENTTIGANSLTENPQFSDSANFDFSTNNSNLNNTGNSPGDCDEIGLCYNFVDTQKIFPYLNLTVYSANYDSIGAAKTIDHKLYSDSYAWRSNGESGWIIYDHGTTTFLRYVGINGGSLTYKTPNAFRILVSTTGTADNDFSEVLSTNYVDTDIAGHGKNLVQWFELSATASTRYIKLVIDSAQADYDGTNNIGNVQVMEFYAVGPKPTGPKAPGNFHFN